MSASQAEYMVGAWRWDARLRGMGRQAEILVGGEEGGGGWSRAAERLVKPYRSGGRFLHIRLKQAAAALGCRRNDVHQRTLLKSK